MPAYCIFDAIEVTDATAFGQYLAKTPATIELYGGRYLVRGATPVTLEGDWKSGRLTVVEFPSAEDARRWYESAEYAPLKPLRQSAARINIVLAEGV